VALGSFLKYDLLIEKGFIIDGTGNPWFKSDIGVIGDHVKSVGDLRDADAERRIDCRRLVVAPGFIDIHSHSDFPVLLDPRGESKVRQGVTVEVVGNCGTSAAPMNSEVRAYRENYMGNQFTRDFIWETMEDYLNLIDERGASFNVVALAGHGTVRQNVMGFEMRAPTDSELRAMRRLIAEAMEDGAWGMSTGLIYPPSCYADTDEIVELARVLPEYRGVYFSHIRGEGDTLLDAVKEAITIGERTGVPVEVAHFKASGGRNWGKTEQSLRLIEDARRRGLDITFDQYPYIASSTGLTALLPDWALEGGAKKLLDRLRNPEERQKIAESPSTEERNWDNTVVSSARSHSQYEGKSISEIARLEGKAPFNAVFDLLLAEEAQVNVVIFEMSEDDVRQVMHSPYMMVGSDGRAVAPGGALGSGKPHPRYYGTFPRILGYYVREGVLTIQEAVRKMTSFPAQRLGLRDRGLLREGFKADITIFDPDKVKDEATFTDPHRFPMGIPYVIVNGTIVVDKAAHTGALPGKALRKKK